MIHHYILLSVIVIVYMSYLLSNAKYTYQCLAPSIRGVSSYQLGTRSAMTHEEEAESLSHLSVNVFSIR